MSVVVFQEIKAFVGWIWLTSSTPALGTRVYKSEKIIKKKSKCLTLWNARSRK
jgi:hypothetical protein